jgi:sensor histidine kinase regulating citrate/malate metabolism
VSKLNQDLRVAAEIDNDGVIRKETVAAVDLGLTSAYPAQPFFRGSARSSNQGLGPGLYVASEIARAHGGKIDVASSKDETRFTLRIPRT